MPVTMRIIRPASREKQDLLTPRKRELEAAGFRVLHEELPEDPRWRYTASDVPSRAKALMAALTEKSDVVIAARGGYGVSDLLPHLDFDRLAGVHPPLMVGFSDISALHSALYTRLGWSGLHAPMPATLLWRKDGHGKDIDHLLHLLRDYCAGRTVTSEIDVQPLGGRLGPVQGRLFGGCFTVLSALIGTPYFPKSLAGHLLFVEDTDENPGRIARCLNQWIQSDALKGVAGIVFGHLRGLGENVPDSAPFVLEQLAERLGETPTFHSPLFGHTSPNYPLMVGALAEISHGRLTWRHQKDHTIA